MKVGEWRYLDSTEIEIVEAAVEGWDVEDGGDVRGEAEEESEEEDKELRAWSISDVQAWLRSKGYGRYTEQFKEEGVGEMMAGAKRMKRESYIYHNSLSFRSQPDLRSLQTAIVYSTWGHLIRWTTLVGYSRRLGWWRRTG